MSDSTDRRTFLKVGLKVGAGATVLGAASAACLRPASPPPQPPPSSPVGSASSAPRAVASAAPPTAPSHAPPTETFELQEATLAELQAGLASGRFTARSLVDLYLARIDAIDRGGPELRAVLEVNPDARAIADALDVERKGGRIRGPLHGVPVLVKDNLDTADRMHTTAGSLALEGARRARDSFVVERLRAAGAIIVGKANLSEWANIRSSHSSSGWSARGGQCRNPYALDRSPSGSSSGTGAAVAANLVAIGIGTETNGSILSPSSACGIVGIKPTVGLVSRAGIVPIAHSQDTAGPMARTVTDAAILLGAIMGRDARDAAVPIAPPGHVTDFELHLDPRALSGARIGVARKFLGVHRQVDALVEGAIDAMRRLGATIVDPADLPSHGKYREQLTVLLYELKSDLGAYLASLGGSAPVKTLRDVIEFNTRHADREMPFFGQDLFEKAEEKGPLTDKAYRDALAECRKLARDEGIDAVMRTHRLDAIVAPTGSPAWCIDHVNGDHFTISSSTPAAIAGYPSITVPAGFVSGLPVGISFFGRAWSEARLIGLAYAFEQATKARRPPRFVASIGMGDVVAR